MIEVVLSIGSNFGNKRKSVSDAIAWLESLLESPHASSIYETPEIYGRTENYMNAVVTAATAMDYEGLNAALKRYETSHGRTPMRRERGEVPVDIDIVVWDDEVIRPRDFNHSFFQIGYREVAAEERAVSHNCCQTSGR